MFERYRCLCVLSSVLAIPHAHAAGAPNEVVSPDGRVRLTFEVSDAGVPQYSLALQGDVVITRSRLGVKLDGEDFTSGVRLVSATQPVVVRDEYEMLTAKRRRNVYEASRRVFRVAIPEGGMLDVAVQASNDGVGIRYEFPKGEPSGAGQHEIVDEITEFAMPAGTKAWVQPLTESHAEPHRTNPAYEEHYEQGEPIGTPSRFGAGWAFPALFHVATDKPGGAWALISEVGLERGSCASRLQLAGKGGTYRVSFPDPSEVTPGGGSTPRFVAPWHTPWRIVVVGNLKVITESMLGFDLAPPARSPLPVWVKPGLAAWSWNLLKDEGTVEATQRQYVDYAAEMGWPYVLIDAQWDKQIGDEGIARLATDAKAKGVSLILWYNSGGSWNSGQQTPHDVLVNAKRRIAEFARLRSMGIAGIKVDFFGGDGRSMIDHYLDILDDAWDNHLLVNFHGCTFPRGWSRTYPHLVTAEAVRGVEHATFSQAGADRLAQYVTMLPFTRNTFDGADFTPMFLEAIPGIQRRTTKAFELATAFLITSGVQHLSEGPEGMSKAPQEVRDLLRHRPPTWDDVRFVAGSPGQYAVLARRSGANWYIVGVNGESTPRTITIPLKMFPPGGTISTFEDSEDERSPWQIQRLKMGSEESLDISMRANGGFVAVLTPD